MMPSIQNAADFVDLVHSITQQVHPSRTIKHAFPGNDKQKSLQVSTTN